MQYVHIKNLEEYHPGYQDRNLIWCKAYFKMNSADPEFEMLCEIDKWRFMAFVMLELQVKKPIPLDEPYLTRKGFDFKKRSLSLTVGSLKQSIQILNDLMQPLENNNVTQLLEVRNDSVTQNRVEESREEESRVDKNRVYVDFEKSTLTAWNLFCDKHPILSKIKEISQKRRDKLKKRYEADSFNAFDVILIAIEKQPFLLGKNDRNWKVNFDWVIENDTNYLKVLELNYLETKSYTRPEDNRDAWKARANKDCTNCRGDGSVYAPGSGKYGKCGCVK